MSVGHQASSSRHSGLSSHSESVSSEIAVSFINNMDFHFSVYVEAFYCKPKFFLIFIVHLVFFILKTLSVS